MLLASLRAFAQTPSPALLVLEKSDNTLAIVDPTTLKIVARVPAGEDPHEVVASDDGKLAYISNYGGEGSTLNTISVVDLVAQKALRPIDLGALHSAHGLAIAGGELYFTAETNKVIARYDPAGQQVDWILGTGQDRTHMIAVAKGLDRIITSNVSSGTISIIETGARDNPGAAVRKTWVETNVRAGNGSEGFDVSPDGREIWVANAKDGTATIIDIATKKTNETVSISVKGANRLKFTPDGTRVLISGLGNREGSSGTDLAVVDVRTRKEVKLLNLGGGSAGILIAPDGARAYVAVSSRGRIAVVDLKSLTVIGQISTGNGPDGLAWVIRP
jgi:YVTN family beta-propeller protein